MTWRNDSTTPSLSAKHKTESEFSSPSTPCLDPQFDQLIQAISTEVAMLAPAERPRVRSSQGPMWLAFLGGNVPAKIQTDTRWGMVTASLVFGIGVLGLTVSLPGWAIGADQFELPMTAMAIYCCILGGSCLGISWLASRIEQVRRLQPESTPTPWMERFTAMTSWVIWLETTSSLLSMAVLCWVGYDFYFANLGPSDYAGLIRRGLIGLFFASVTMELQYLRMLRKSLT